MMKALLSTCLLLALLSPGSVHVLGPFSAPTGPAGRLEHLHVKAGYHRPKFSHSLPLQCRFTFNKTGLTYEGNVETTCNFEEDACAANVLRTNINQFQAHLANRCAISRSCHSGHYSFTAADGKFFELKKQCCNTKLCNNEVLSLPDRNLRAENGLQCPACFSKGKKMCKSEKTLNCLENETQCLQYKGAILTGVFEPFYFTFQGCGTDFCSNRRNGIYLVGAGNVSLVLGPEIICYNASPISHQPEHEE
ncbi:phospholipase A2 inhibitor and Ly6/PLAUR domain-containing protein [Zootoca vivipara]|uniref:phospholipase A2 inhibitor and Ly6/PLAUR domain-containing protein n=1 Tax=Zootoca vivipara TaxID=8524 RepID=UPI001591B910|nr:phospholipase A2 inhibitor and Ly6/PLAUR domain-containing protein [Zootoca vivipara]